MIPFESDLTLTEYSVLNTLLKKGQRLMLKKGTVLTRQYQRGAYFYLLLDGILEIAAQQEPEGERIRLGTTQLEYAPIGWSALNAPYRYTVDVTVQSESATILRYHIDDILKQTGLDTGFGIVFYQFILARANLLIEESLEHLSKVAPSWEPGATPIQDYQEEAQLDSDNILDFIRRSPFFESFDDQDLQNFADTAIRRDYRPRDLLYEQGSEKNGFYLLSQGWIDFIYRSEADKDILFRSISTAGFNLGWLGFTKELNYAAAVARRTSSVLFFDPEALNSLFCANPKLALRFFRRLLWLVGHQIQVIRTRYLTLTFDIEWIAVKTLVESHATRLPLHSALHEIPHLLKHKHSQKRAFDILHMLHEVGSVLEKHLSSLCLDNLQELEKEYLFYQGLLNVYQQVQTIPEHTPTEVARKVSAKASIEAFSQVNYMVDGWDNLPETSGNIIIYNHLRNHPYNTLPNNFQVTLDSHFISGLISFQKYHDPGLRVVRVGRDVEYGHQDYYQRLGHIDVYTQESEKESLINTQREEARKSFYAKAGQYLTSGKNLIISPEGASYETHESPGIFKSGAFRLALSIKKEPWIVPIVMANFDKRARYNQFKCKIGKPFRVSEFISNAANKKEMKSFLLYLEAWYKNELESLIHE